MGIRLVGAYSEDGAGGGESATSSGLKILGTIDDMVREARDGGLDVVYMTDDAIANPNRINSIIRDLGDSTVSLFLVPSLMVSDLFHARWSSLGALSAISVFDTPSHGVDGWLKRIEDIVIGSACLLVAALPMATIACAVKLSSSGPVLFRQLRYGLDAREISVWKFRTMRVCEDGRARLEQATRGDGRVTTVGGFLRRTSLDELPQLFNVLHGTMSLVGPRPHAVAHNEQYRKLIHGYMLRHKVKPGITGLAQIRGWRGETDTLEKMERRVACDFEYVQNWSVGLDIEILLATLFVPFTSKNAY